MATLLGLEEQHWRLVQQQMAAGREMPFGPTYVKAHVDAVTKVEQLASQSGRHAAVYADLAARRVCSAGYPRISLDAVCSSTLSLAFWDGVLWATKTFDNEGRFWHNLECHSSHSQPFRFVLGGGGRKPEIWTPFAPDKDLMAFLNSCLQEALVDGKLGAITEVVRLLALMAHEVHTACLDGKAKVDNKPSQYLLQGCVGRAFLQSIDPEATVCHGGFRIRMADIGQDVLMTAEWVDPFSIINGSLDPKTDVSSIGTTLLMLLLAPNSVDSYSAAYIPVLRVLELLVEHLSQPNLLFISTPCTAKLELPAELVTALALALVAMLSPDNDLKPGPGWAASVLDIFAAGVAVYRAKQDVEGVPWLLSYYAHAMALLLQLTHLDSQPSCQQSHKGSCVLEGPAAVLGPVLLDKAWQLYQELFRRFDCAMQTLNASRPRLGTESEEDLELERREMMVACARLQGSWGQMLTPSQAKAENAAGKLFKPNALSYPGLVFFDHAELPALEQAFFVNMKELGMPLIYEDDDFETWDELSREALECYLGCPQGASPPSLRICTRGLSGLGSAPLPTPAASATPQTRAAASHASASLPTAATIATDNAKNAKCTNVGGFIAASHQHLTRSVSTCDAAQMSPASLSLGGTYLPPDSEPTSPVRQITNSHQGSIAGQSQAALLTELSRLRLDNAACDNHVESLPTSPQHPLMRQDQGSPDGGSLSMEFLRNIGQQCMDSQAAPAGNDTGGSAEPTAPRRAAWGRQHEQQLVGVGKQRLDPPDSQGSSIGGSKVKHGSLRSLLDNFTPSADGSSSSKGALHAAEESSRRGKSRPPRPRGSRLVALASGGLSHAAPSAPANRRITRSASVSVNTQDMPSRTSLAPTHHLPSLSEPTAPVGRSGQAPAAGESTMVATGLGHGSLATAVSDQRPAALPPRPQSPQEPDEQKCPPSEQPECSGSSWLGLPPQEPRGAGPVASGLPSMAPPLPSPSYSSSGSVCTAASQEISWLEEGCSREDIALVLPAYRKLLTAGAPAAPFDSLTTTAARIEYLAYCTSGATGRPNSASDPVRSMGWQNKDRAERSLAVIGEALVAMAAAQGEANRPMSLPKPDNPCYQRLRNTVRAAGGMLLVELLTQEGVPDPRTEAQQLVDKFRAA